MPGLAPRSELAVCGQESMGGMGMWPLGGAFVGVADHPTAKLSGHSFGALKRGCLVVQCSVQVQESGRVAEKTS